MNELIDPVNFLLATRDAGYRSTSQAVAEFVDNAIQAKARRVHIEVSPSPDSRYPLQVSVIDDGTGMDAEGLAHALTFGGSSRFNDRTSLGRYGMGLPNGALSRAQRVEVYSWQGSDVLRSYLDIDAVTACPFTGCREPRTGVS
jgi:DNA topoisomerase VI subunit B